MIRTRAREKIPSPVLRKKILRVSSGRNQVSVYRFLNNSSS